MSTGMRKNEENSMPSTPRSLGNSERRQSLSGHEEEKHLASDAKKQAAFISKTLIDFHQKIKDWSKATQQTEAWDMENLKYKLPSTIQTGKDLTKYIANIILGNSDKEAYTKLLSIEYYQLIEYVEEFIQELAATNAIDNYVTQHKHPEASIFIQEEFARYLKKTEIADRLNATVARNLASTTTTTDILPAPATEPHTEKKEAEEEEAKNLHAVPTAGDITVPLIQPTENLTPDSSSSASTMSTPPSSPNLIMSKSTGPSSPSISPNISFLSPGDDNSLLFPTVKSSPWSKWKKPMRYGLGALLIGAGLVGVFAGGWIPLSVALLVKISWTLFSVGAAFLFGPKLLSVVGIVLKKSPCCKTDSSLPDQNMHGLSSTSNIYTRAASTSAAKHFYAEQLSSPFNGGNNNTLRSEPELSYFSRNSHPEDQSVVAKLPRSSSAPALLFSSAMPKQPPSHQHQPAAPKLS